MTQKRKGKRQKRQDDKLRLTPRSMRKRKASERQMRLEIRAENIHGRKDGKVARGAPLDSLCLKRSMKDTRKDKHLELPRRKISTEVSLPRRKRRRRKKRRKGRRNLDRQECQMVDRTHPDIGTRFTERRQRRRQNLQRLFRGRRGHREVHEEDLVADLAPEKQIA